MGRTRLILAAIAAIAIAALAMPAAAADDPSPRGEAQGKATMQAAFAKALSGPPRQDAGSWSTLAFESDASVRTRERNAMVERIDATGGAGSGLAKAVESDRLLDTFDRLLRRYGYAPDNLGDVTAAYLVLAWEVVNDADSTRHPSGIRAVRAQVGPAMAGVAPFSTMDDATKQAQAQQVSYMAMVATTNRQAFEAAKDSARLESLRRDVRAQVLGTTGIALDRYTLTDAGLVPR